MRLNFMSMLIVGLVILSVVVVSDKRMMSSVTTMCKKVTLGSKKMNQVAVLFLGFLLLLCMMKGKRTVEGLCGCRTGENLDVTIQAGSDFNCPHTGTGRRVVFDDETAREACDCSEGQCEVGHTAESLRDFITGVPQEGRRMMVEQSSGMGAEAYLSDVIGLAGSRLSEMVSLIDERGEVNEIGEELREEYDAMRARNESMTQEEVEETQQEAQQEFADASTNQECMDFCSQLEVVTEESQCPSLDSSGYSAIMINGYRMGCPDVPCSRIAPCL